MLLHSGVGIGAVALQASLADGGYLQAAKVGGVNPLATKRPPLAAKAQGPAESPRHSSITR